MILSGKKVLVTGHTGFIGKMLVEELKKQGNKVLTMEETDGNILDIRDWNKIKQWRNKVETIDLIYHLAAITFVPYSFENPRQTYEVNVLGTLNVLELCRLYAVKRMVFSSGYIYGYPKYLPIDEQHPMNPINPYARSKELGERFCKAYHEDYGLNCTILRLFNIYGEGQRKQFLIPSILSQLPNEKIELMDSKPKRDFLYVRDAIAAFLSAGAYDNSKFEIFNIGSGISYSVAEVTSKILNLCGRIPVTYTS